MKNPETITFEFALDSFIDAINATGGVAKVPGGLFAPVADMDWTDLGDAYIYACTAMGVQPRINAEAEAEG